MLAVGLDGCTSVQMRWMSLNWTLGNGYNGQLYVVNVLTKHLCPQGAYIPKDFQQRAGRVGKRQFSEDNDGSCSRKKRKLSTRTKGALGWGREKMTRAPGSEPDR